MANLTLFDTLSQYPPCVSSIKAAIFAIILVLTTPCFSDETRWYDGFFIEGSFHQYFAPDILYDYVKTKPGFRAALGYDFRHFRFAVESGYTNLEGTNPLVLDVKLIPLALKFGYEQPLFFGFGVQADLLAGYFFSRTIHYETAIDMMTDNLKEDNERNLFAGARLYATWTTRGNFLKIYAGGGADVVIEPDGPIPLPLLEAGISIKPFTLIRRSVRKPVNPVYFEVNSATMIEQYLSTLDAAGRRLQEKPSSRITLRAYYAPPGNAEWQPRRSNGTPALSAARAEQCAEYLRENYGINPSRIKIEYRDAGNASNETQREMFRCVDLIIR